MILNSIFAVFQTKNLDDFMAALQNQNILEDSLVYELMYGIAVRTVKEIKFDYRLGNDAMHFYCLPVAIMLSGFRDLEPQYAGYKQFISRLIGKALFLASTSDP